MALDVMEIGLSWKVLASNEAASVAAATSDRVCLYIRVLEVL
jgi:hypothetical protein